MNGIPRAAGSRDALCSLAERRSALDFSVESVWQGPKAPFGIHKPWLHLETAELKELSQACPELCAYAANRHMLADVCQKHSHNCSLKQKAKCRRMPKNERERAGECTGC